MKIMPLRYTKDVEASARFYRSLGLDSGPASRAGGWVEMPAHAGMLAIHAAGDEEHGACELAFETDEPLEDVAERMRGAGYESGPVIDENYGRSVRVLDPDGVWVQINQYDRDLYT
ncbi:VOC family protein [Brevibacterium casei]|uniref:Glyoxalase-like domain-containing protein n=2 Tax=Brevibacterium casei TaxID=33889 RepID=A0A2H1IYZ3_9MICO|nr:VOC family protein [Brevibacterium casei]PAK93057.1 hypothetical protein B8X04_16015 [Brevibacterium casei]QPR39510.1 VOC family protein [Brevibacterium casei]QPR43675.1 VOC family protein [Brevibacterium casei]SMX80370.1 Glyoxalase-like domain-containing protein [Brevibacterium casei CIP 102111]